MFDFVRKGFLLSLLFSISRQLDGVLGTRLLDHLHIAITIEWLAIEWQIQVWCSKWTLMNPCMMKIWPLTTEATMLILAWIMMLWSALQEDLQKYMFSSSRLIQEITVHRLLRIVLLSTICFQYESVDMRDLTTRNWQEIDWLMSNLSNKMTS